MLASRSTSLLVGMVLFPVLAATGTAADPPGAAGDWPYTKPARPAVPATASPGWVANPIDAFVLEKLESVGLAPSPAADKLTLLRRVTFDLTGLPPTVAEQEAFLQDTSERAYERVVDRLLASPRYGERWAQHWLDLVRYAESDGFKADDHRPHAYRYRDYVIRAFNEDLPYDRFIRQQLAGDELEPGNLDALIATGFNRLWPDEYNAANLEQRRQEILDDMTEVTGLVFLGLTIGCARCHDHKFDPILQTDHYRLQAFFAPMLPRDAVSEADPLARAELAKRAAEWEQATAEIRVKMNALMEGKRSEMRKQAMTKFRPEIQEAILTAEEKRTPYQKVIAAMAEPQIRKTDKDVLAKLSAAEKKQYQELEQAMAARGEPPPAAPQIMAVGDVGLESPPTHLLANGHWEKPLQELTPGFPLVLGDAAPDFRLPKEAASTGRRAALARWLASRDNPLTARVIVNRLWQQHFGRGIVATANDFGKQGEPPTHPELLDWLAVELMDNGWRLKHLHRLMVLSSTYRQTSLIDPNSPQQHKAREDDPANQLLWRASRRRLEGEAIRDAMLAVSGELNPRMLGPSARPKLPEGISKYAWKPDAKPEEQNRRSVYVMARRNMRFPLFDSFDLPDMHNSCACRPRTTTAPQALLLLNGEFTRERAAAWARSLAGGPEPMAAAFRAAWGRPATKEETRLGQAFLEKQARLSSPAAAFEDFCHALLNSNEFLYVD